MRKLILLLCFLNYTVAQNLEYIASIGDTPESIILSGQEITQLPNHGLLLSDKVQCKVFIYDNDMKLINSFGRKGNKLGEFKAPSQLAVNENFIVVADFASSRVQVFNKNFEPYDMFFTEGPIFDMVFDRKGYLLIGVYTGNKNKVFFRYKIDGELVGFIKLKNTSGDQFKDIFRLAILENNFIILGYFIQNLIEIYNEDYEYVKTIEIAKLPKEPDYTKLSIGLEVPEANLIKSITSDMNNNIYILADKYVKNPHQTVLVLDLNGKCIREIILPQPASEIFIDNKGFLYVLESERTILKKYRMK